MKKFTRMIKALVPYVVFAFSILWFVSVIAAKPGSFRFRNGDPVSDEQRIIYIFVILLFVVIAGYGAFKTAKRDWRLWQRKHKHGDRDHVA